MRHIETAQTYVMDYIETLREAFDDIYHFVDERMQSGITDGFILGTMVLTPLFGSFLFFTVLVFG